MTESVFNFFNQGWVGSLIGVLGLLVGALGIISYKISKSVAKPSYQKSSLKILGRDEDNLPEEVKITFKGKEVERLTKTTIILWNNGTEVLDGNNIVEGSPLKLAFEDCGNILSYKVLKRTKEVNDFEVVRCPKKPHVLLLNFLYLDPNDGITLEIHHDSEKRYPEIDGVFKGIPDGFIDLGRVNRANPSKLKHPLTKILNKPKQIFFIAVFVGVIMTIYGFLPSELSSTLFAISPDSTKEFDKYFFMVMGPLYALLPASALWLRRKRYPKLLDIEETEL